MNDQHDSDAAGDGQQGTGGVSSGQATSTPDQRGRQPHLGSRPDADSAPGGTGQSESEGSQGLPSADAVDTAGVSIGSGAPETRQDAAVDRLDAMGVPTNVLGIRRVDGRGISVHEPVAIRATCCRNHWATATIKSVAIQWCRWLAAEMTPVLNRSGRATWRDGPASSTVAAQLQGAMRGASHSGSVRV